MLLQTVVRLVARTVLLMLQIHYLDVLVGKYIQ